MSWVNVGRKLVKLYEVREKENKRRERERKRVSQYMMILENRVVDSSTFWQRSIVATMWQCSQKMAVYLSNNVIYCSEWHLMVNKVQHYFLFFSSS